MDQYLSPFLLADAATVCQPDWVAAKFYDYDTGDSKQILKQAIKGIGVNLKHYTAASLANQISKAKSKAVTFEQFRPRVGHPLDQIVAKVYPEYQKRLKLANAVDFDDLLLHAVDLLRDSPELRDCLLYTSPSPRDRG